MQTRGPITIKKIIEWIFYNDNLLKCCLKLSKNYQKITIVEFWDNNFKLKIEKNSSGNNIGSLFGLLEDLKPECSLAEYSISQTSLEQIFNYFALQNDETVLNYNKAKEIIVTEELLSYIN